MANYISTIKTNYFRVTDEEKYKELFEMLSCEDEIHDLSQMDGDGVCKHCFGAYGDVDYYDSEDNEYDLNKWFKLLQQIIPDDEAFIITGIGNEKLKSVGGWVVVVTNNAIEHMNLGIWALSKAREFLNDSFDTEF